MTTAADFEKEKEELTTLLNERGVDDATPIVDALTDVVGGFATVAKWDDKPGSKTTGLLVWMLRHEDGAHYKRPEERQPVTTPQSPSPELLKSMRGVLNTPNGITREEAKPTYEAKARRLGMTVDALIDLAMGADWMATPVHPALDPENPRKRQAYAEWLG